MFVLARAEGGANNSSKLSFHCNSRLKLTFESIWARLEPDTTSNNHCHLGPQRHETRSSPRIAGSLVRATRGPLGATRGALGAAGGPLGGHEGTTKGLLRGH